MLNLANVPEEYQDATDYRALRSTHLGGGGIARYQYGVDKQRTRKHIMRLAAGGTFSEDRIYLGELYHRRKKEKSMSLRGGGNRITAPA
jgi:hypothetical protein